MGVLNVTPDSFSDGGHFFQTKVAIKRAEEMVEEGADIIDVGGESTRPGSEPISLEEELTRVIPVIKSIASNLTVPISIDTYKPQVAREALEAGASIINDVYGLRQPGMLELLAEVKVPVVIMHMKGAPKTMQQNPTYQDVVKEVADFLKHQSEKVIEVGLESEKIVIDPGIGFGKTLEHNLQLLKNLSSLSALGFPVLVGPSRKSFIGLTLGLPVEERLEGTLAVIAQCVWEGASIVRVHDVKEALRVVKMVHAIRFPDLARDMV
jgi:dihydropteroate synthase